MPLASNPAPRGCWGVLFALSCSLAGCTADPQGKSNDGGPLPGVGGASGNGAGGSTMGESPGGGQASCDSQAPGVAPLLKLTTAQYRNTVRDLLRAVGAEQVATEVAPLLASIPEDSLTEGFRGLDNRTSLEHVQGYFNVGVAVADAISEDATLLTKVAGPCAAEATLSSACVDAFLGRFVALAQRAPLDEADHLDYAALNDGARTPAQALRAMMVVALSSPRFVHQIEVDGAPTANLPDLLQLGPYEIAARLSYTFWQTMPDAELFRAAEDGSLATEAGFDAQLARVFDDPRTRETLFGFWNEWLRLEKFTGFEADRPAFKALAAGEQVGEPGHAHYADMVSEVRSLTELFTFDRPSTLSALLTTNLSTTKSADLARLYGVPPWSGAGPYPELPAGSRGGLLQRGALLVSNLEQTNPFHRGAFIRRYVLCDPLPQPDPNRLPPGALDPPPPSAQTTRQRYQAKVEGNGLCDACHASFSDIGYVLESFDSLGRFRTSERVFDEQSGELLADLPIVTTGRINAGSRAVDVTNAGELNQLLAESGKVEECMARHYFEYTSRRLAADASTDACVVRDLARTLREEGGGIAGAFRRVAKLSSFFQRKVGPK